MPGITLGRCRVHQRRPRHHSQPPSRMAPVDRDPGAAEQASRISPPSLLWLLLEGRAMGELATTLALRPLLRRLPRGDGHSVLLLPGFLATDFSTRPLRSFLRTLGYWSH